MISCSARRADWDKPKSLPQTGNLSGYRLKPNNKPEPRELCSLRESRSIGHAGDGICLRPETSERPVDSTAIKIEGSAVVAQSTDTECPRPNGECPRASCLLNIRRLGMPDRQPMGTERFPLGSVQSKRNSYTIAPRNAISSNCRRPGNGQATAVLCHDQQAQGV